MRIATLLAASGLLLAGCSSTSFLAMQPATPNGPSLNGHPTSRLYHPDSVEVKLGFVRYDKKELVFEVEIGNDARRPLEILPETFYYVPDYSLTDAAATTQTTDLAAAVAATAPGAPALTSTRVMALDPEATLQQLTARLNKEAAKAESGSWLEILSSVANITEDIASIKKTETPEQIAERDQRHADDEAYFADQRATHAQQADELSGRKQHLESVILRKTVLQSNEYITGQVHFPRTDAARRLRVVLFVNARPVVFDFTQKPGTYSAAPSSSTASGY
ncbi:hypothetical protein [Hymenobacter yonginensis]|uniref:DUF4369 domain-containing protein n=1 Tax=Hymenobacter yonginensis TaxID=748197 RepID=A0ABY7PHX5_9BACT|nr:hypothetical protein [Hymenobacter yonginensis]WBO82782.1 hypothetical protein O9Z63_10315 [Hymenobacter yonginensis]